jgi:ATP-dependent Lhr-like helicase
MAEPLTMTSHPSDSSPDDRKSAAFERLNPYVQKWIWSRKWDALKDVQEAAIGAILDAGSDIVIAAPTAAGKTEAAFLPICSQMIDVPPTEGIGALYISPLKALINDQYDRLCDLFLAADIPVHRWHGDVPAADKASVWSSPRGILLITPESIEAMFVTRGYSMANVFRGLRWIVVDELHAYLNTARGKQVQSLLHRVDAVSGNRVLRIGLSATLGDMAMAAEFLRPGHGDRTQVLVSESEGQELRLQVKGYVRSAPNPGTEEKSDDEGPTDRITDQLFRVLRGGKHLVFANSRRAVEIYADRLRQRCELEKVPNEFFPHHGNLSKAIREDVELRLKDPSLPTTAVCTSTLELGIDVGQVVSIGQIGAPFSVAAIRQRLGRSGRRGDPAVLRMHISAPDASASEQILDGLYIDLVQAVAVVELLVTRWCEPPDPARAHLSTLVHQTLSLIAERGGVKAQEAWNHLCRGGAFRSIGVGLFADLLRRMGQEDLIVQSADGDLVLGAKGERIVNHFSFFAVFESPEEYRIVCDGHALGTVSVDQALIDGIYIIFAGRRWCVLNVDRERKIVTVSPAPGGRVPMFEPSKGGLVHDRVRQEMRRVYDSTSVPKYLDTEAAHLLEMARRRYRELGLNRSTLFQDGSNVILFACRGDRIVNTLAVLLTKAGLPALQIGPAVVLSGTSRDAVHATVAGLLTANSTNAQELAAEAHNKRYDKYDWALSEEMLNAEYARRALDVPGTLDFIRTSMGANREALRITKALFLSAQVCTTQSWLSVSLPSSPSAGEQKRMREGHEIAEIARRRFPSGVFVTKQGSEDAVDATRRELENGNVEALFEATFAADGLVARVDIMTRKAEGWRVIEVKSGTAAHVPVDSDEDIAATVEFGARTEYIADLAYTLMVLRRAGIQLCGGGLLLLNPEYRLGDPESNLLVEVDCWVEADLLSREFESQSESVVHALQQPTPPAPFWKRACKQCDYFAANCLGRDKRHPITEIPGLRETKMRQILDAGATEIADVPDHIDLGDNHTSKSPPGNRVRACVKSGRPFMSDGLNGALATIRWPAYYLDFETLSTAIPIFADTSPWEAIPAQYSLHVQETPGGFTEQQGYIVEDPRLDCRRELAERLISDLGATGSVMTYSGFEAQKIAALAMRFPDLRERLESVRARIVDLCEIVAAHYYHPNFRGRVSIKVVLPVLVDDLDYSDLEIVDGDTASAILADAARGVVSPEQWKRSRAHLYDYCARDTLAMVRIHRALLNVV